MILHPAIILFNMFGWIWKKTRLWNLFLLLLTAASWFILGIWYGWGYCISTDWHWNVLRKLGYTDLPSSYIKFLIQRLFGLDLSPILINRATIIVFIVALIISVILNIRDYKKR